MQDPARYDLNLGRTIQGSGKRGIPVELVIAAAVLLLVGMGVGMLVMSGQRRPVQATVKPLPTPAATPLKPAYTPPAPIATPAPPPWAQAPVPAPTFTPAPAYTPAQAPTQQTQQDDLKALRAFIGLLDQIDAAFEQTAATVRSASDATQAKIAVAQFVARINSAETAMEASLERDGVNRYLAPPEVRRAMQAVSAYHQAGQYLDYYLTLQRDHWLVEAASKQAEARSERNALAILAQ